MKGGRTAPRNLDMFPDIQIGFVASMKGGRTAPRNKDRKNRKAKLKPSFNEGGADCPPKPR